MKRTLIILTLSVLAGVAAFSLMRSHKAAAPEWALLDAMPELAWVRRDLDLTEEQFAKVSELHAAYRPTCLELCRDISKAHAKLASLTRRDRAVTPELEAAIREHAEVHARCQRAMLRHIYETAAAMDEKRARRYLETMLPYTLDFTQDRPEGRHSH